MGKEKGKKNDGDTQVEWRLCIQMSSLWQATGERDLAIKYSLKLNAVDTNAVEHLKRLSFLETIAAIRFVLWCSCMAMNRLAAKRD
jgi:hypothetical protein